MQSDAQCYFNITAKTLHEKRRATQYSGYSKHADKCHNLTLDRQPVTTKRRKRRRASAKSAVKPPAPDCLWTEDGQIRSTTFAEIEALLLLSMQQQMMLDQMLCVLSFAVLPTLF